MRYSSLSAASIALTLTVLVGAAIRGQVPSADAVQIHVDPLQIGDSFRQEQSNEKLTSASVTTKRAPPLHEDAGSASKVSPPHQEPGAIDTSCIDEAEHCDYWAEHGECESNVAYMHTTCRAACGLCKSSSGAVKKASSAASKKASECVDSHPMCATWASIGECDSNPGFMHVHCPVTCHLCQSDTCLDVADDCASRSIGDGCYRLPSMGKDCAWTCGMCNLQDKPQCARDRSVEPAAVPGSLGTMFERITQLDEYRDRLTVHLTDPWLITISDFVTSEEADAILAAGGTGFHRSMAGDGVHAVRTSSTSWCSGKCQYDPTVTAVEHRIGNLTGIYRDRSEWMQVLRYEQGQFYKTHHDQNSPRSSPWGPRMLTAYLYLNDVEEGGGTRFPQLNVTVEPRKGTLAMWPSVTVDDPWLRDDRTEHEAVAVAKGVKYGANMWLHMFDFRHMTLRGCANEPYVNNWY